MKNALIYTFSSFLLFTTAVHASGTMDLDEAKKVKVQQTIGEQEKQQQSILAGLIAEYEFEAKRLIRDLETPELTSETVNKHTYKLIDISESILLMTRFRLPQCDAYLSQSMVLKDKLDRITHEQLEKDYHLDAALPQAPGECYHTKDMFVHPATVAVLNRDDPALSEETRKSMNAEITEVLAHTEVVRALVL